MVRTGPSHAMLAANNEQKKFPQHSTSPNKIKQS